MKKRAGFTLIELLITISILGTLTVLAAQAISQAIKVKGKLQDQIDDVSRMRDAMRLIERDINLAYHYRDLEKDLYDIVRKSAGTANGQQNNRPQGGFGGQATFGGQPAVNQTSLGKYDPFNPAREAPRKDPETHFVGELNSFNLVTSNNARTMKNSKQADFIEVGYSLKDCKSLREDGSSSKCLWRRSTPFVDDDVTKGGDEVVLLENVTEFKVRYIGKGKQDWVEVWRTDTGGDASTKGKFPEAVEVSLTVEKKDKGRSKKYSMQNIIPVHFPNNDTGGTNGSATNPAGANANPWSGQPPGQ